MNDCLERAEVGVVGGDGGRDYTYDELLERAFAHLRERNPDMATGEKKKLVMKPPQVRHCKQSRL